MRFQDIVSLNGLLKSLFMKQNAEGLLLIYRIGRAFCNTDTGYENVWNDLVFHMILACITLKAAPKIDLNIEMTPVNILCKALIHIAEQNQSLGKTFHLVNKNYISFDSIIKEIINYGFNIQYIPYKDWISLLNSKTDQNYGSYIQALTKTFSQPESVIKKYLLYGTGYIQ